MDSTFNCQIELFSGWQSFVCPSDECPIASLHYWYSNNILVWFRLTRFVVPFSSVFVNTISQCLLFSSLVLATALVVALVFSTCFIASVFYLLLFIKFLVSISPFFHLLDLCECSVCSATYLLSCSNVSKLPIMHSILIFNIPQLLCEQPEFMYRIRTAV